MRCLDANDLTDFVFPFVSMRYGRIEEVPDYEKDATGMPQLLGVLVRVKNDTYYPTLLDKATYVLVGINQGHFLGTAINDSPLLP